MADTKVSGLTNLAAPTRDDLLYLVNNPAGVPASHRATVESVITGPSLFVAASDATTNEIKHADYICDGTEDEIQIQAAIDALPASGGTVRLSSGNFTVTRTAGAYSILIDRDDVKLEIPTGTMIKLADNELSLALLCNLIRIGDGTNARSNIIITGGGVVDANVANNPSTGNIAFGAAIFVYGPHEHIAIDGITVQNVSRDGIYINGESNANRAKNITVQNCLLYNVGEGIVFAYADWIWVLNNHVDTITGQDGIQPGGCNSYWFIVGNTIQNLVESAIDIYAAAEAPTEHGVVANNIILGSSIYVAYGIAAGREVRDVLICNNLLDGSTIVAGPGPGDLYNLSIVNNIVSDGPANGTGITVGAFTVGALIESNVVSGHQWRAIHANCDHAVIVGNTVFNNGQDGGAVDAARQGILVENATGVQILANAIYDDQIAPTQSWPIMITNGIDTQVMCNSFSGHRVANTVQQNAPTTPMIHYNVGYITENDGAAAAVADGGTIAHGCAATPTSAQVTGSVANEFVSVTAIGAANLTVAIKKHDGTPGTNQTIYWRAWV